MVKKKMSTCERASVPVSRSRAAWRPRERPGRAARVPDFSRQTVARRERGGGRGVGKAGVHGGNRAWRCRCATAGRGHGDTAENEQPPQREHDGRYSGRVEGRAGSRRRCPALFFNNGGGPDRGGERRPGVVGSQPGAGASGRSSREQSGPAAATEGRRPEGAQRSAVCAACHERPRGERGERRRLPPPATRCRLVSTRERNA